MKLSLSSLAAQQRSSKIHENKALHAGLIGQSILIWKKSLRVLPWKLLRGVCLEGIQLERSLQQRGQDSVLKIMVISLGNKAPRELPRLMLSSFPCF